MATIEERVSYIEGAHDVASLKTAMADLRTEIKTDISNMRVEIFKWLVGILSATVVGLLMASVGAIVSIVVALGD